MTKHKNRGLQKICGCARKKWTTCPHAWHFSFQWHAGKMKTGGKHYRFSLDGYLGRHIDSRSEAEDEAATIRRSIKAGTFGKPIPKADLTVRQLADEYEERYVKVKRAARAQVYTSTLALILRTAIRHPTGGTRPFGEWPVADVVPDTIERFRETKLAGGTGIPGTNRLLSSLRALWAWGLGAGHVTATPFRRNGVPAVKLEKEHPRSRRLASDEESKLLAAAGTHLHAVIVAAIETGMRRGEILSLQWAQVEGMKIEKAEVTWPGRASIFLPHEKTKTRTDRRIPISGRLRAILEMRRFDPAGHAQPLDGYVFGTEIGTRVLGFKRAWATAVLKAHGHTPTYTGGTTANLSPASRSALQAIGLHFHDLRREAGSRWLEGGVPLHTIRDWLGHTNIAQTSTYLSGTAQTHDDAMARFEARSKELVRSTRKPGSRPPRTAVGRKGRPNKTVVGREPTIN